MYFASKLGKYRDNVTRFVKWVWSRFCLRARNLQLTIVQGKRAVRICHSTAARKHQTVKLGVPWL